VCRDWIKKLCMPAAPAFSAFEGYTDAMVVECKGYWGLHLTGTPRVIDNLYLTVYYRKVGTSHRAFDREIV